MTTTFPATIKPTIASQRTHKPRVKEVKFGNGYRQVWGDGINSNLEDWKLSFIVTDANKTIVHNFLNTANGYIHFNWTNPESGATQKQYTCPSWTVVPLGRNQYNIQATFKEWAGLS